MPGEAYYAGLTLPEQVQKFLDHHYDPKTRHISAYEAHMLDQARARMEQTIEVAKEEAARELGAVYEAMLQVYETLISGANRVVAVHSFPIGHLSDPTRSLDEIGLTELIRDPSPSQVQVVLASLMSLSQGVVTLADRYKGLETDRRLVERELDEETLALINRLLYEPTVVAQNSWADVASLLDHLNKAKTKGAPVVVFGGALVGTGNVVVAFVAGSSVIALQLLQHIADGMAPGLRALGEKLTASWQRPSGSGGTPAGPPRALPPGQP